MLGFKGECWVAVGCNWWQLEEIAGDDQLYMMLEYDDGMKSSTPVFLQKVSPTSVIGMLLYKAYQIILRRP